jgi:hypothetical protein
LNTKVLIEDETDHRVIGDIVGRFQTRGEYYMKSHLPHNKAPSWWDVVLQIKKGFDWTLYCVPELPHVKPYANTLEFHGGHGCHRALAVALLGADWLKAQGRPLEVLIDC